MGMFNHKSFFPSTAPSEHIKAEKNQVCRAFPMVNNFSNDYNSSYFDESDEELEQEMNYLDNLVLDTECVLKDSYPEDYYSDGEDDFENDIDTYGKIKQDPNFEPYPRQVLTLPEKSVKSIPEKTANQSIPKRPNCYDICQRFLKYHHIRNCGGLLYIYTKPCYTLLTADIAKGMILDSSRKEIGAYGSSDTLRQVYEFLRAETSIKVSDDAENSSYVIFRNGRLNLDTQVFEHNGPDVFAVTYLNFDYCEDSECPNFKEFLRQITGGNKSLEKRIWEVIGYCWSSDMRAKAFFLFKGVTGTGKSTLLRLIRSGLVMNEGECTISVHELSSRFALSNLAGKRLVSDGDYGDAPLSAQSVAIIKTLTGLDSVRSESKGVDAISVRPTAKLIICSNTALSLRKADKAFEERGIIVPFENPIPEEDRNPNLFEKLQAELPSIANFAFKHYSKLRERGYRFSKLDYDMETVEVHNQYVKPIMVVDHNSTINDFFGDCCEQNENGVELTEDLFSAYIEYCKIRALPVTNKVDFSTRFGKITNLDKTKRSKKNGYLGVKLKVSEDD